MVIGNSFKRNSFADSFDSLLILLGGAGLAIFLLFLNFNKYLDLSNYLK